ncbi:hypothetical protein DLJ49_20600 [Rhodovulum sp. 12E13]|uniref:hypothetical protein n=1 Tax=Rhodovulum sp. 12E13 TaxID=2203891 RepID=UPI000E1625E7|nr:hypothetical protein [Rhodovulum sp. 12E13]RDC67999.1 hypothetical protein DLJ49_20600 [Rhodovulum sp. 12E13]
MSDFFQMNAPQDGPESDLDYLAAMGPLRSGTAFAQAHGKRILQESAEAVLGAPRHRAAGGDWGPMEERLAMSLCVALSTRVALNAPDARRLDGAPSVDEADAWYDRVSGVVAGYERRTGAQIARYQGSRHNELRWAHEAHELAEWGVCPTLEASEAMVDAVRNDRPPLARPVKRRGRIREMVR